MSTSSKDRTGLCTFTFDDGRHCNMPHTDGELRLCYFHERREAQRLINLDAAHKIGRFLAVDVLTASDLTAAFATLFRAGAEGFIESKMVNSLTRLGQLLLKTQLLAKDEYLSTYQAEWPEMVQRSIVFNLDPDGTPHPFVPAEPTADAPAPSQTSTACRGGFTPPSPHDQQPPDQASVEDPAEPHSAQQSREEDSPEPAEEAPAQQQPMEEHTAAVLAEEQQPEDDTQVADAPESNAPELDAPEPEAPEPDLAQEDRSDGPPQTQTPQPPQDPNPPDGHSTILTYPTPFSRETRQRVIIRPSRLCTALPSDRPDASSSGFTPLPAQPLAHPDPGTDRPSNRPHLTHRQLRRHLRRLYGQPRRPA